MSRNRLTITLRSEILKQIDALIDKTNIRNRSHAIESLLLNSLETKVTTAVILAGGEGIKLRPLTYELPKSLIPIKGKPLVEHTLDLLRKYKISNVIFAVGHLGDKIINYFGNGEKLGLNITYRKENERLGTEGALKDIIKKLVYPFLVLHGDILADINLADLIAFHERQNFLATMVLTTTSDIQTHGNVQLQGANILKFLEKPKKGHSLSYLINTGIYVFDPKIHGYLSDKKKAFLENSLFPQLAKEEKLGGFTFSGKWFDITDNKSYEQALKNW